MLTKWELTKWELTKWEVDKVGTDEVHFRKYDAIWKGEYTSISTVQVKSYTKLATPTMYQSIVFSPPLYAKKFQTLVYSNVFSPLPGWL